MSAELYVGPLKPNFMTSNEDGRFFPLTLKANIPLKQAALFTMVKTFLYFLKLIDLRLVRLKLKIVLLYQCSDSATDNLYQRDENQYYFVESL